MGGRVMVHVMMIAGLTRGHSGRWLPEGQQQAGEGVGVGRHSPQGGTEVWTAWSDDGGVATEAAAARRAFMCVCVGGGGVQSSPIWCNCVLGLERNWTKGNLHP